ncbi:unnamed protein product [Acanthoscelides obtectus]|uniref:Methyltransferase domain-containing protein n=1 Tax=Acanthoscelides obtectus TaxID=200917 RepID=A0A9P0LU96_ACAOB|nr:unnamed protein product [Acanthoscelides obtectus]CAK1677836.1 Methyltransferase-like protein 13 [Acanthoscelides obtectus]
MNLLPKSKEDFSQKEYWDTFFKKRGAKAFEWYGEYLELADNLHKYIKKQDNVLITGCGNSTLGRDLYNIGYENITNIDISPVVIRQMLSNDSKDRPNLKYIQMDALNMSFESQQFSVVLDKGTLDALMPDDKEETVAKIKQYFDEVTRVLKNGGRYICVSLLQEHILRYMLQYFPSNNYMFRAVRCFEAEKKAIENGESCMPVFMVICTKFSALPRKVLELNLGSLDKMQRYEKEEEIILSIANVQNASFVCSGLKRSNIGEENEVVLDLYEPGSRNPRFTVYVVDIPPQHNYLQYAGFIVPEGREAEWLFSTKAGRKNLVRVTKHNRLAIITLHRGQKYESLDAVQKELSDTICNLAPSSLNVKKIPFLSLGSDVGHRTIRYEGNSQFSGDYVIEDVITESGDKYRRLFYTSSQLVIQSEGKLRQIKSRKGAPKEVVDLLYLTCRHHVYMSLATYVACREKRKINISVIGLGGGGLCSFLHKFIPKSNILGVDIDPEMLKIATEWFGFQQNDRLQAKIQDGLEYIKEAAQNGGELNAILFDVDSKDSSVGMSCPPRQFLEKAVLINVAALIGDSARYITGFPIGT